MLAGLDALSLAMLLFLLSAGLSITFGLMRILNMAHTSFYLLGGYVGIAVGVATRSFWLALLAAAVSMAVAGVVLYSAFLRRVFQEGGGPPGVLPLRGLLVPP